MSVTADVFEVIETAVVAALATVGITCYPYESAAIDVCPCATLSFPEPDTDTYDNDQSYGFGPIVWTLRYYVDLSEGEELAQQNMKIAMAAIITALARDRSLGGKCRTSKLGRGTQTPIATAQRPELMYEATFTATPHPNFGV